MPQLSAREAAQDQAVLPHAPSHRQANAVITGIAVVLVILLAGSLRMLTSGGSEAQQQARALRARQITLKPQLSGIMSERARFVSADRTYVLTMRQVTSAVAEYKKLKDDDPSTAQAPDLAAQVSRLRRISKDMTALHADLVGIGGDPAVERAYAQLVSAADALGQNAKENAAVVDDAVTPAGEKADGSQSNDLGSVKTKKLKALNGNDALLSSRRLTRSLTAVITGARLNPADYGLT